MGMSYVQRGKRIVVQVKVAQTCKAPHAGAFWVHNEGNVKAVICDDRILNR
jgi:hypothetical protein